MNSPAIRFAGCAEDWEERKLGDVAEFNPKAVLPNTFEYVDLESVVGTELIGHRTESRATAPSRAQRLAQRGDVFYQTVRPYQKNNYIFTLPYCDYVFSTGYAQMRPSISSSFLFSRLQGDSFVKTVLDRCTGTSYPAINATDLSEVKIMMPDDEVEQAKIGATFCKLDRLITLHQREHDKTVNIKKALLEKMFPKDGEDKPEIRFAGFTGAWEQRKLGNLVEFFSGLTYSPHNVVSDGTLVLRSSNVKEGAIINADNVFVEAECVNVSNVQVGDIVVVVRNGSRNLIGKHALIKRSMPNTVIGAFMTGLRCHIPEFTNALLDTHHFDNEIKKNLGATINQITTGEFKKMTFFVPEQSEQKKIGRIFTLLDNLIAQHQRELTKLQNIKKALLEKMIV